MSYRGKSSAQKELSAGDHNEDVFYAYQNLFNKKEQRKIEALAKQFKDFEDKVKVWVKDATPVEDPEDEEPPFKMEVFTDTKIAEMEVLIRQKMGLDPMAPLNLVYGGTKLESKKCLNDYPETLKKERKRWAHPYVGIIFICPHHIEPGGFTGCKIPDYEYKRPTNKSRHGKRDGGHLPSRGFYDASKLQGL